MRSINKKLKKGVWIKTVFTNYTWLIQIYDVEDNDNDNDNDNIHINHMGDCYTLDGNDRIINTYHCYDDEEYHGWGSLKNDRPIEHIRCSDVNKIMRKNNINRKCRYEKS